MLKTHAVGIDLGTTYSCIAHLNEHGQPVTLANQEGELQTPSVVLFDDSGEIVVGTEALRNAVVRPDRVIQNSKRYMGDPNHQWVIDGRRFTPVDVATLVLKKLLTAATEQIGTIEQAVITVPAQFSEIQRQQTVQAGLTAGLKRVDIINEPVAAALCYVLGTEGLWFTELADQQRILVYDLGGGTFDLSLVRYQANEVNVIASSGDLNLGGIDWNRTLLDAIAGQFAREFKVDPRQDPHSLQFLALEVENAKRSLTVRPKTALTCQHAGHRKSYQVEQPQFEKLTQGLVDRTCELTQSLLKDNRMGWAHVDVILTVGGSSRMPMIRNALKQLGGRTLNTSLSPDQSIAHGATYYAGMLLTNSDFAKSILNEEATARLASIRQQSVNSRGLGIIVRDEADNRIPHYLIPANTPLPASVSQTFGTVIRNQKRVHLRIVESGTAADQQYVELGTCIIEDLPAQLPENSQVEVTIRYDEQARVHVSARDVTSGRQASTEIVREGSVVRAGGATEVTGFKTATIATSPSATSPASTTPTDPPKPVSTATVSGPAKRPASSPPTTPVPPAKPPASSKPVPPRSELSAAVAEALKDVDVGDDLNLEDSGRPIPLCNECGEPLNHRGACPKCAPARKPVPAKATGTVRSAPEPQRRPAPSASQPRARDAAPAPQPRREPTASRPADAESKAPRPVPERSRSTATPATAAPATAAPVVKRPASEKKAPAPKSEQNPADLGEEEFWKLINDE